MYKRITVLALTMAMLCFAFSGCGGSASSSSTPSTSTSYLPQSSSQTGDSSMGGFDASEDMPIEDMPGEDINDTVPENGMTDGSSEGITADGDSSSVSSSEAAAAAAPAGAWELVLVNPTHFLPDDFSVEVVSIDGYPERSFDARAAEYLERMLEAAKNDGFPLYLVSSYRSVSYQTGLYRRKVQYYLDNGYTEQQAKTEAAKWVAVPGTSEHSLGLAADIVSGDWYINNSDLTEEFENTPQFEWLVKNCAEYGFILRYPKNAEAVTGIHYEPWHYRYVGVKAAKEITEKGITLEEYLGEA